MRFALATVALAGAVLAQEAESTVYSTEYYTVTSCGPTVTNCPAKSTVVSSSVVPMTTSTVFSTTTRTVTDCPDTVTHCPADSTTVVTETIAVSTTVCPVKPTGGASTSTAGPTTTLVPTGPGSVIPPVSSSTLVTAAPVCPTVSVKTIKTSITTVIPTIIYETVQVPCSTGGPKTTPSGMPTTSKPPQPTFTAGAATMGGSAFLAVAAGLFALA